MKKPPPKEPKPAPKPKKTRKVNSGKKRAASSDSSDDEVVGKDETASGKAVDDGKASKGTTTQHFVKFMNELLDVMDTDETLKGRYLGIG